MKTDKQPFYGGLPTEMDVQALITAFGLPAEGTHISYSEVATILKVPVKSYRWLTIVSAWRKRLERESDIMLKCEQGTFVAMTPSDRVSYVDRKVVSTRRMGRRIVLVCGKVDRSRLTNEELARVDHAQKTGAALLVHERLLQRQGTKAIAPPVTADLMGVVE